MRSTKAQAIHTQLFSVLMSTENRQQELSEFEKLLKEAPDDILREKSANGFSLLHDLLHLGGEQYRGDPTKKDQVLRDLFTIFLTRISKNTPLLLDLLTSPNYDGYTPLHAALISGQSQRENFEIYSNLLESVMTHNSGEYYPEVVATLTQANGAGFTPLHEALLNGQSENFKIYSNLLESLMTYDSGKYFPKFKGILTQANEAGFTPLHDALINGQRENFKIYFFH